MRHLFLVIFSSGIFCACGNPQESAANMKTVDLTGSDKIVVQEVGASSGQVTVQGEEFLIAEALPADGAAGKIVTAEGGKQVIRGGTTTLAIAHDGGADGAANLLFEVEGKTDEFFRVPVELRGNTTSVNFLFSSEIPADVSSVTVNAYVETARGQRGEPLPIVFTLPAVTLSGPLQVSISWDTEADVDLHVIEPGEFDIFYADRESPNTGKLDLDSNAACNIDHVKNENTYWSEPPAGEYQLAVVLFSPCDTSAVRFSLSAKQGAKTTIYSGTLTPEDKGTRFIVGKLTR